ncbi:MAG: PKD domain-containing protein [Acidimicrobiales bacterium]|nr:PKD domain-containing protein [Acidimicrobiales bacterium]
MNRFTGIVGSFGPVGGVVRRLLSALLALCLATVGLVVLAEAPASAANQTFVYTPGTVVTAGVPAPGAGNIEASGDSDTYTFSAQQGQMLTMTELACSATGDYADVCRYYTSWELKSPSDTTLGSGSFFSLESTYWTAPETGTYTLVVSTSENSNPDYYTATYSFQATVVSESDQTFSYSPGTTVSDGVPTAGQGNLETSGASDTYTFTAQAGQMLTMTELACSATGDYADVCRYYTSWELKSPSDTTVASGSFFSLESTQWTALETGTYTLVVSTSANSNPNYYAATYSFVIFSAEGTVPSIGTFDISPSSGSAPLAVSATISATDADGDPLIFMVDWGDGSSSTVGALPTAPVAHTYTNPGTYQASLLVSDGTNPAVSQQETVTASSPTPPTVDSFGVTPNSGVASLDAQANFSASDPNGDPLTYVLDWGDGSTPDSGTYPAGTLAHTYVNPGTYHPTVTVTDGTWTDAETQTVLVTPDQPLAANAGDDRATSVGETVTFDGTNSTPAAVIDSYEWSFSDGTVLTGPVVTHSFAAAGTYGVVLTVEADGVTNIDSAVVTVVPAGTGTVVTVESSGSPVPSAQVLVQTADGVQVSGVTDSNGVSTLWGLPDGDLTVFAYKQGFMGGTGTVTVTGGNGAVTVNLPTGSPGSADMETHALTYQEIIDAGIDPNDPANQHVFEYDIVLVFGPETSNFTYLVNSVGDVVGGTGGGGGGNGGVVVGDSVFVPTIQPIAEGVPPAINWLVIPGEARWLKEFFEVRLIVSNLAPAGFTFTQGTATLELPDGLVLAPTPDPQSLTVNVGDVAGGTQQEVSWIVRGDAEGEYFPAATYSGVLAPITAPINLRGETPPDKPVKVWACSALQFLVQPDDHLDQYEPYRVRVGLKNVSDVPVYNVSNELKQDGRFGFIFQPLEDFEQSTAVIEPGDTFWADYVLMPWIPGGDLSESLSFVTHTGGDCSLPWVIDEQPAPTSRPQASQTVVGSDVQVNFDSVPGAVGYDLFGTTDVDTLVRYGAPNGLQPDEPFPTTPLVSTNDGTATSLNIPLSSLGDYDWVGLSVRFADGSREMLHNLVKLPSRVSIGSAWVTEGNSGTTNLTFPVRLSAPSTDTVTVDWATATGAQPEAGVDFEAASGTVTFAPGETEKDVDVTVYGDTLDEVGIWGAEWMGVTLSNSVNAVLPGGWGNLAFGVIVDDDPTPSLSIGPAAVTEGDSGTTTLSFPVTLSAPSGETVTVDWTTASGDEPEAGVDYEAANGTLTFAPGETQKYIDVTVYGDTVDEPGIWGAEWMGLILSNSVNATLPGGWGNLTFGFIVDDD